MGKREKAAKAEVYMSSEEDKRKRKTPTESASSDGDTEANEDLSLKIVQKSLQRAVNNDTRDNCVFEIVADLSEEKSKKEKKKRKKNKEAEVPGDAVDNVKDKEKTETDKVAEISSKAGETNPVGVLDNVVLRKLLRGPRYFDPPDNSWGVCYNCGKEGHTTVNCTSAKRKKPCFVCGSFEHNAKQCAKGRDCFVCKQQGHQAKDCPERNKRTKMCLKCGDFGHDMFSCRNDYCPDDLKEIQCYVCGRFGHLCCRNYSDPGPREVTCYRCGLSGHTGLACLRSRWDTNDVVSASSCHNCGLEGHFARECTSSVKASKRDREPSTPKRRSFKKKRDLTGVRSAPHDVGKIRKKKSWSGEFSSPAKTKHKGGWITEDPGDHYRSNFKANDLRSPATPSDRRAKIPSSNGDYASSSRSSQRPRKMSYNNSPSNLSTGSYQHRYSASRFGNTNGSMGRNNNWR